ncbi:hypothetical protein AURDEDRAFT_130596 [Auricularia subglabra TFB-10046 SS5]|uniref:MYND-type domain-containing protein n=1 Tax=Auricularia subglabra (strain TFB-10046 / SS5) TaxID=717982 RepID=J0CXL2_AURST|nr:hypothetical protein AURDEDRAFT_130596 [Auricularia subglabra TFB-10046 SS5]
MQLEDCAFATNTVLSILPQPVPPALRDAVTQSRMGPVIPTSLLYIITLGPGAGLSDHQKFMRSWEVELFTALDAVLRLPEGPDYVEGRVTVLVRYLWDKLSEAQRQELGYTDAPRYLGGCDDAALEPLRNDPYVVLHCLLKRLVEAIHQTCAAADCRMNVQDKATPGGLSRCGKCRFVRYCSKECQKAAWTHAERPHKEICDMLTELFTFANMDMRMQEFTQACRERCFPLERADTLAQWAGSELMFHDANSTSLGTLGQPV